MESMLQRHCARYIYVIPDGLREIMSDISREVLRNQPKDMYTFIADYMDALLVTRENARIAARLVQSLTELATTTAAFLEETGMSRDEVDHVVAAIQQTFERTIDSDETVENAEDEVVKDILEELNLDLSSVEVVASIIQGAYKSFKERKENEKNLLSGMIDWRAAARSAIYLYRQTGVSNAEANRAATLIKAAYKGYYTRKLIKNMLTTTQKSESEIVTCIEDIEQQDGDKEEMPEDFSEEVIKTVTIDYNTVIPHVDFDTGIEDDKDNNGSTVSSIAKFTVKHLFDNVLNKIGAHSTIFEDERH